MSIASLHKLDLNFQLIIVISPNMLKNKDNNYYKTPKMEN